MKLQQGDVILKRIWELPKNARKVARKARGFVLAEGEHTGHAHVITEDKVTLYEDHTGTLYLKVEDTDAVLRHTRENGEQADHMPVTIEPGLWRIGIVREYDPFHEEIRRVQD